MLYDADDVLESSEVTILPVIMTVAGADLGCLWRAPCPEGARLLQQFKVQIVTSLLDGRHCCCKLVLRLLLDFLSTAEVFEEDGTCTLWHVLLCSPDDRQGKISQAYVGVNTDYMEAATALPPY